MHSNNIEISLPTILDNITSYLQCNSTDDARIQLVIEQAIKQAREAASTRLVKLMVKDVDYFDFTATAAVEDLVYNNIFDFKDRIETCVQQQSNKAVRDLILKCLGDDILK